MAIRYGMIGAGMMGREHLRNLHLLPEAEVKAICEPDEEQQRLALEMAPGIVVEPELGKFLSRDDLDALIIATPNHTHFAIMEEVLQGPPRGILLEKPAVTTLDQARALRHLARDWPKPLWVAMEYRYMPPMTQFIHRCHQDDLGALRMVTIREHRFPFLPKVGDWNRFNANTGGTLVEKCCHFFYLFHIIYRATPTRVYASGGRDVNHLEERYEGHTPDILDNAFVLLEFPGSRRAMLELCMFAEGSWFQEEITAVGSNAKLECRIPGPARFWPGHEEREAELIYSPREPKGPERQVVDVDKAILRAGDHHGATYYQHRKFLDAMLGRGEVEVNLEEGLEAVRVGLAAERSIETGESVCLDVDEG